MLDLKSMIGFLQIREVLSLFSRIRSFKTQIWCRWCYRWQRWNQQKWHFRHHKYSLKTDVIYSTILNSLIEWSLTFYRSWTPYFLGGPGILFESYENQLLPNILITRSLVSKNFWKQIMWSLAALALAE